MYAEVIEEIVPLTEPAIAAIVVTFEYLDVPFGLRVFVGKDTVFFGCGDVFLDLYCAQVEGLPALNSHKDVILNFLKSFADPLDILSKISYFTSLEGLLGRACDGAIESGSLLVDSFVGQLRLSPRVTCANIFLGSRRTTSCL